jgi:hypothetical protein
MLHMCICTNAYITANKQLICHGAVAARCEIEISRKRGALSRMCMLACCVLNHHSRISLFTLAEKRRGAHHIRIYVNAPRSLICTHIHMLIYVDTRERRVHTLLIRAHTPAKLRIFFAVICGWSRIHMEQLLGSWKCMGVGVVLAFGHFNLCFSTLRPANVCYIL